jgi:ribosomal protein RSM22 (predicted rRNA methylase)
LQLPAQLATAIESLVAEHDFKQLRAAAERTSETYRAGATGTPLEGDVERAAYLAVRFPATYAAVSAVLEELKLRAVTPRSMLDLGAGPGTATMAAREQFPALEEMTLVERDAGFVAIGRRLAAGTWIAEDLRSAKMPPSDLVIAAYSLGELSASDAAGVVERAWKAAQALCVIEPGTPRGYATIMRVREQLMATGAHLVAPCPHERRCPMDESKDWCHFAARVERTSLHRRMKSGELGWEDEKFSYVIFSHDPEMARAKARIVRHPQVGKGHIKLELCAQDGLGLVTISKKQGEVYRRARRVKWGDAWDI